MCIVLACVNNVCMWKFLILVVLVCSEVYSEILSLCTFSVTCSRMKNAIGYYFLMNDTFSSQLLSTVVVGSVMRSFFETVLCILHTNNDLFLIITFY